MAEGTPGSLGEPTASRFLTAAWRYLVMANYEVDPVIVTPYVPRGTELDLWQGRTVVSMVGFRFLDTRVLGIPIPFHRDFDEVNLRLYVRREGPEGWRRGVVFVKELVPKAAIAWVARTLYNESYVALPMRHRLAMPPADADPLGGRVAYEWRTGGGRWNRLAATVAGTPQALVAGSEEEFITEHYWGYARQRDGGTVEYRVEHPPWRVWSARTIELDCAVGELYGEDFFGPLGGAPRSAFVAEGSPVVVRRGRRIARAAPSHLGEDVAARGDGTRGLPRSACQGHDGPIGSPGPPPHR